MIQFVYCILIIDPITLEQIDKLEFYSEQDMDKKYHELRDEKYQTPFVLEKVIEIL